MEFTFDFTLTTPLMLFPAISLLMLAYTNRFVVLADLIRGLYERHRQDPHHMILAQIGNLQKRMQFIKTMQVSGAASFLAAIFSVLASIVAYLTKSSLAHPLALLCFFMSLLLLLVSMIYLLRELSISIDALAIQLDDLRDSNHKEHADT